MFSKTKKVIFEIDRAMNGKALENTVAEFIYATYLNDYKILNHSILFNTESGRIFKSNIFDVSKKLPVSLFDLNNFEIESSQLFESMCCICYLLNQESLMKCRHNVCRSCLAGIIKANLRKACPLCGILVDNTRLAKYRLCKDTNVYSNFGFNGFLFEEEAIVIFSFFQHNPLAVFSSNKKQTEFAVKEKTKRCDNIWKIKMKRNFLFSIVVKKIFGYVSVDHTSDESSLRTFNLFLMLPDRCIIQTNKCEMRVDDIYRANDYFQQLINYLTECNSLIGEKKYDSGLVSSCLKSIDTKKNNQDLKATALKIQSNKKLMKRTKLRKKITKVRYKNHALKHKNLNHNKYDLKQLLLRIKVLRKKYLDTKMKLLINKQNKTKKKLNELVKRSEQLEIYFKNEEILNKEESFKKVEYESEYENESDLDFGDSD